VGTPMVSISANDLVRIEVNGTDSIRVRNTSLVGPQPGIVTLIW
jgi:hypothetical protein